MKSIKVFAPATVSNVTCGFDILGFAIESPGDEVIIRLKKSPGISISKITGDGGRLPLEPEKNTAGISVINFLNFLGLRQGVQIELHKKMPLGSGLGSSAASAVGSVFGLNELLGRPLKRINLLPFAMEGEKIACGSAHADNVAPSLLGGFVVIRSYNPLDVIKIKTPKNLYCTVIHPDIEIRTEDARKILPIEIPLKDAVTQWGNVAGFITGLINEDYQLISRSMEDIIIEPIRSKLIPGFENVKAAAIESGALGFGISGSGPSLFALSKTKREAEKTGKSMSREFEGIGMAHEIYISKVNSKGPTILG